MSKRDPYEILIVNPSDPLGRTGLTKWFGEKWVDICTDDLKPCGRDDDSKRAYPKCRPIKEAKKMTKAERESACRRKRRAEKEAKKSRKEKPGARKPVYVDTYKNPPAPITGDLALITKTVSYDVKDEPQEYVDLLVINTKELNQVIKRKKGKKLLNLLYDQMDDYIVGFIGIHRRLDCDAHWEVYSSASRPGYGPMIYDLALSLAYETGSGLMPDREKISVPAQNIWKTYKKKRTDVDQLDIIDPRCPLYGIDKPDFNVAYSIEKPLPQYEKMEKRGERVITKLSTRLNESPTWVKKNLIDLGVFYFQDKYGSLSESLRAP